MVLEYLKWKDEEEEITKPVSPAKESQPIRSETNSMSSSTGSHR
jgi:hypothetical protein